MFTSFQGDTQRRQWQPTPVLVPGKSHGRRSFVGLCPWGREESDTTKGLHFHFSLSCIGEGKGTPLQCSCLESPRDGGAWWAAVYGVTQSRTRLKRLSSSSSHSRGDTVPKLRVEETTQTVFQALTMTPEGMSRTPKLCAKPICQLGLGAEVRFL